MKKLNFKRWLSGFCIVAAVFGISSCKNELDVPKRNTNLDVLSTASISGMTINLPTSRSLFKLNAGGRPVFNWEDYKKANNDGKVKLYCAIGQAGAPADKISYVTFDGVIQVNGDKAKIVIKPKTFTVNGTFNDHDYYIAGFLGGSSEQSGRVKSVEFSAPENIYQIGSNESNYFTLSKIPFYFPYVKIDKLDALNGFVTIPSGKFKPLGALIAYSLPVNAIKPTAYSLSSDGDAAHAGPLATASTTVPSFQDGKILNSMMVTTNAYANHVVFGFTPVPDKTTLDNPGNVQQPSIKIGEYNHATVLGGDLNSYQYTYHMIPVNTESDADQLDAAENGLYAMDAPQAQSKSDYDQNAAKAKKTLFLTWGYACPMAATHVIGADFDHTQTSNGRLFGVAYKLLLPQSSSYKSTRFSEYEGKKVVLSARWEPALRPGDSFSAHFESGKNLLIHPRVQSDLIISEVYHSKTDDSISKYFFWQYDMVELYNPNWTPINLDNYAIAKTKFELTSDLPKGQELRGVQVFQDCRRPKAAELKILTDKLSGGYRAAYQFHPAGYDYLNSQLTSHTFKMKLFAFASLGDRGERISNNRYRKNAVFDQNEADPDTDPIAAYWPTSNAAYSAEELTNYPYFSDTTFGLNDPHPYTNMLEGGKTFVLGAGGIYTGFTSNKKVYSKNNIIDEKADWFKDDFPMGKASGNGDYYLKNCLDNGLCQNMLGVDNGYEEPIPEGQFSKGISMNGKTTKRNWGYRNAYSGTLQIGGENGLMLMRKDNSAETILGDPVWIPTDVFRCITGRTKWDTPYGNTPPAGVGVNDAGYTMQRRRSDVFPDRFGSPENWQIRGKGYPSLGADDTDF